MSVYQTRLRWVAARNPNDLVIFLQKLPFKVEIKGAPQWSRSRWYLFFVLPEDSKIDFISREID